jgi:6-phosphogluconolactonase (cycloisomerase 2 family)
VVNISSHNVSAYAIDAGTGALTALGPPVTAGINPYSVVVDPSGQFAYVSNESSNDISPFIINAGGALAAASSPVAVGTFPRSVTVDFSGGFAYVANAGSDNISVFTIDDASNGALTAVGSPVTAGSIPHSVITTGKIQ